MSTALAMQQSQIPDIRGCLTKPKKSQYFQAVLMYTDGAGHEMRKSKSTREARKSDAFLVMMQMIQDEKDLLKTAALGTMLTDFLRFWLEEVIVKTVEETTWNGYRMNLENHIIPYFEPLQLRLKDVRPLHIDGFMEYALQVKDDGKQLKAASVQRFYANLKTALDYAQKKELIEYNPARMLKAPKAEQYEAQFLSIEQIAALWKACKGTVVESAVFLASIYGFRRGEVCGLRWEHVDMRMHLIRIFETRTRGKTEVVKGTKTVSSKRTMPMMRAVEVYLSRLLKLQETQREYCGNSWTESGYVVVDELGVPVSFARIQKHYKRALQNAGLPEVRFHDLRHSVATYLLELGIPIEEVSAWLGHSSIAVTSKVYAHVNIGTRRNAARRLDKLMGFESAEQEQPKIELALFDLFELSPGT